MTESEFTEFIQSCRISAPGPFAAACETLRLLLIAANEKSNLTRLTGETEFRTKHVADSLGVLREFPELVSGHFRIADIGCGAGFPSLILALANPRLEITAIDSRGKKTEFVSEAAHTLHLDNLKAVHGRGVELNRLPEYRGKFDIVTARAVADAVRIWKETSAFLKPQGCYLLYKTPDQAKEELPLLRQQTPLQWLETPSFELPDGAGCRCFLVGKWKRCQSATRLLNR